MDMDIAFMFPLDSPRIVFSFPRKEKICLVREMKNNK